MYTVLFCSVQFLSMSHHFVCIAYTAVCSEELAEKVNIYPRGTSRAVRTLSKSCTHVPSACETMSGLIQGVGCAGTSGTGRHERSTPPRASFAAASERCLPLPRRVLSRSAPVASGSRSGPACCTQDSAQD
ncbi:uncharacterized protein CC84DRAFT_750889 [Paraphaeosphaeria sporulosa]|uniref:Secreted protein n=1 Tax=Paraphaeosphaeria sporulosa TaxID=1460663 RepID=A0A177CEU2_9PLEO|nr:uncharacterized protein CC84DRAFT_750889 [Paraphaeosphaeria sporulosa]OAG06135.1 hypothetical protein CC84DRAFT_750889 [Paraphaeosphaeria sporulosa]